MDVRRIRIFLGTVSDSEKSGIAMYALSSYLDSCYFITVPVTADGITDVYVVSCLYSMLRVMNQENL